MNPDRIQKIFLFAMFLLLVGAASYFQFQINGLSQKIDQQAGITDLLLEVSVRELLDLGSEVNNTNSFLGRVDRVLEGGRIEVSGQLLDSLQNELVGKKYTVTYNNQTEFFLDDTFLYREGEGRNLVPGSSGDIQEGGLVRVEADENIWPKTEFVADRIIIVTADVFQEVNEFFGGVEVRGN